MDDRSQSGHDRSIGRKGKVLKYAVGNNGGRPRQHYLTQGTYCGATDATRQRQVQTLVDCRRWRGVNAWNPAV